MAVSIFGLGNGAMASNTDIQKQIADLQAGIETLNDKIDNLKKGTQKGFDLTTENIRKLADMKYQGVVQTKIGHENISGRGAEEVKNYKNTDKETPGNLGAAVFPATKDMNKPVDKEEFSNENQPQTPAVQLDMKAIEAIQNALQKLSPSEQALALQNIKR